METMAMTRMRRTGMVNNISVMAATTSRSLTL